MLNNMSENSKFITSIGLICVDHIYVKSKSEIKYISSTGGGSASNVIAYLSGLGNNTSIIGLIGNDKLAEIILKDFKKFNVNTQGLIQNNSPTKQIAHIITSNSKNDHFFSLLCPFCKQKYSFSSPFRSSLIKTVHKEIIKQSCLLILDRVSKSYLEFTKIAKNFKIPIIIDLGTINQNFINIENIKKAILNADILQIPEKVNNFLLRKLNIQNYWEINNFLNGVIITANKNSILTSIRLNSEIINITIPVLPMNTLIDSGGAGDTFLAYFVNELKMITNNFTNFNNISINNWKDCILIAGKSASYSCQFYGARGYLYNQFLDPNYNNFDLIKKYGEILDYPCKCKKKETNDLHLVSFEKRDNKQIKKSKSLVNNNFLGISKNFDKSEI